MDDNDVLRVENRRPSEVFLRLWRWHATSCGDATATDFELCAKAWAEIRRMEAKEADEAREKIFRSLLNTPPVVTPAPKDIDGKDPSPTAQDDRGTAPDDPEQADQADPEPEPDSDTETGRKKADPAETGRAAFATRKRRILEGLERLRGDGKTLADIAAAAKGLTISEIMDAIDRKPLALPVWVKIEKAVAALQGGDEDG